MKNIRFLGLLTVITFALSIPAMAQDDVSTDNPQGVVTDGKGQHGKRMAEIDKNGDGVISWKEFELKAKKRFASMDKDGNGQLTKDEMKEHHRAMKAKHKKMRANKASNEQE